MITKNNKPPIYIYIYTYNQESTKFALSNLRQAFGAMVRLISEHASHQIGALPLAIGLFISVAAMVALCAKHSRRASAITTKSPPVSHKKLVTSNIRNKAINNPFMYRENKKDCDESEADHHDIGTGARVMEGRGFGEGGLWQKGILMGEKCRPPEFSGVIHYDSSGNKLSELPPRSPRASPLPNFLFPEAKGAN